MTLLARNGTWVVPTLGPVGDGPRIVVDDSVAMQYVPQETRARWVRMAAERRAAPPAAMGKRRSQERGNIPMLRDAGVGILAGTDTGDEFLIAGFAFHSNLEHLVFAGLSPAEALRAATLGPARFLGASDSLGTVAAGKLADLVLLDANPLVDIRNARRVRTVVANGRVFDRMALDGLLQRAARLANP